MSECKKHIGKSRPFYACVCHCCLNEDNEKFKAEVEELRQDGEILRHTCEGLRHEVDRLRETHRLDVEHSWKLSNNLHEAEKAMHQILSKYNTYFDRYKIKEKGEKL